MAHADLRLQSNVFHTTLQCLYWFTESNGHIISLFTFAEAVATNFQCSVFEATAILDPNLKYIMTRKAKVKALGKDWAKLNDGSPLQEDEFGMKTPEKQLQEDGDMTEIDEEKQLSSGEESVKSSDDNELLLAEEKLRLLQIEEKKMMKKEKLKQIEKATKKIEDSIKGKKRNSKTRNPQLTSASLRSMGEVVSEVDRMMDKNKLKFQGNESSSSASEESESSSSSSGEEEKRKKRKDKKKTSGKEKKVTSYVKYPPKMAP